MRMPADSILSWAEALISRKVLQKEGYNGVLYENNYLPYQPTLSEFAIFSISVAGRRPADMFSNKTLFQALQKRTPARFRENSWQIVRILPRG